MGFFPKKKNRERVGRGGEKEKIQNLLDFFPNPKMMRLMENWGNLKGI